MKTSTISNPQPGKNITFDVCLVAMGSTAIPLTTSGGDLWSKAIADLGDKLPSDVFIHPETKTLQDLLADTESSRERLKHKSWSFQRRNGEVVYVRDLLTKASKWIKHFKDVGDILVQCDPVHAGIPWASVRFLLTVATGDLDTYKNLLDRTVNLMEIISRNGIVEKLVDSHQGETAQKLRDELVKLYISVLMYLAKANSYYKQHGFKNFVKQGLFASSDFESAFADIEKDQSDVDRSVVAFGLQDQLETNFQLKQMIQNFDAPISRWDQALHGIKDHLQGEERRKILRWISEERYQQYHEQAKSEVMQGTGKWLLHDALFVRWKNECASSILWLYGIPGSGKSKLASIVIEDAIEAFHRKEASCPAYFYCSRNTAEPERSDPARVLASIARQLSTPQRGGPILEPTVKEYEIQRRIDFMSGSLRLENSKTLILQLLERYGSAIIVLDALDECDTNTRETLLDAIENLLEESPCLLKIFVTSRTDRDITYKLNNYPNVHLSSDRNTADIDLFIRSETTRLIAKGYLLRDSNRKNELRDMIIHTLTSKAQGMFRLASLQLHDLRQQGSDSAVEERLKRLPKTLEGIYHEILTNIENTDTIADRQYARNALSWLLCARQKLLAEEFLTLVSVIDNGPSHPISHGQLLQICPHFVMFDSTTDSFRFSHLTVREFLEGQDTYNSISVNGLAALACLSKLTVPEPQNAIQLSIVKYPYLFWAEHARLGSQQRCLRLDELLRQFLSNEDAGSYFYCWHRTLEKILERRDICQNMDFDVLARLKAAMAYVPRALLAVCAFDLCGVLNPMQWAQQAQQHYLNKVGETHQRIALCYGSGEILEWQSQNDASFEITQELIELAAKNAKNGGKVVALLLANRGGTDIEITSKMVWSAIANRTSGEEIMALLLDSDATDGNFTQKLIDAIVERFSPSIFQRLYNRTACEVFIKRCTFRVAGFNHNYGTEITAMLLDRSKDEVTITPAMVGAAVYGNNRKEILALFLEHPKARFLVTEEVLETAAESLKNDGETWKFLLNNRGIEVPISEETVRLAATNYRNCNELITILLDGWATAIPITPTVIKAIIGYLNTSTVQKFLNMTDVDILITKDLIDAVFINWDFRDKILALLLERGTTRVESIEEVIKSVVRRSDQATIQQFLNKTGFEMQIDEEIVEAAAQNRAYGERMLAFVLQKQGGEIPISEQIIKSAFENSGSREFEDCESGERIVALLVRKSVNTIPITERTVEMFARHARASLFQQLIDQRPREFQIMRKGIRALGDGMIDPRMEVGFLFKKDTVATCAGPGLTQSTTRKSEKVILQPSINQKEVGIQVTEELVHAAANNSWDSNEMMKLILERRDRRVPVTEDAINNIAMYFDAAVLQQCFDGGDTDIEISQDLLQAAASNHYHGKNAFSLLLEKQNEDISVTEEIVEAAAENWGSGQSILTLLLERRGGVIPITEKALSEIVRCEWNSVETPMLVDRTSGTETLITEEILQDAASHQRELLRLLLDRQENHIKITEQIVNTAAGNKLHGHHLMALLLEKGGPEIPITDNTMEAIVNNEEGGKILTLLLESDVPKIPITIDVLIKARKSKLNEDHRGKLLSHWLNTDRKEKGQGEERFRIKMLGYDQGVVFLYTQLIVVLLVYLGVL